MSRTPHSACCAARPSGSGDTRPRRLWRPGVCPSVALFRFACVPRLPPSEREPPLRRSRRGFSSRRLTSSRAEGDCRDARPRLVQPWRCPLGAAGGLPPCAPIGLARWISIVCLPLGATLGLASRIPTTTSGFPPRVRGGLPRSLSQSLPKVFVPPRARR